MSGRIIVLPVLRIERGLWSQEFCKDEPDARPAPGSRPQLIISNVMRQAAPWSLRAHFRPGRLPSSTVARSNAGLDVGGHNERSRRQEGLHHDTTTRSPVTASPADLDKQDFSLAALPARENATGAVLTGDRSVLDDISMLDETLAMIGEILRDGGPL